MKSKQEFDKELKDRWNGQITEKGYTRTHNPVIAHCNKCGYTWKSGQAEYLIEAGRHNPCKRCWLRSRRMSNKEWLKRLNRVNKKNGTHFKPLTKCYGCHKHIIMKDLSNGHIWKTLPDSILHGFSYLKPGISMKSSDAYVQRKLDKVYGKNHMILLSKYKTLKEPIKVHCCKHHCTWWVKPENVMNGHGCPINHTSHGEMELIKVFKKANIDYHYAYRLHNNKNFHNAMHLDFYLPQYHPEVNKHVWHKGLGIEVDGTQHRVPVAHFGGYDNFYVTKIRDYKKNLYCLRHNIYLVRIPYYYQESINKFARRAIAILQRPGILRHTVTY